MLLFQRYQLDGVLMANHNFKEDSHDRVGKQESVIF